METSQRNEVMTLINPSHSDAMEIINQARKK